jgi:hypothetical protein
MQKAQLASKRSAFGNMMASSRQNTSLTEYSADKINSKSTFKEVKQDLGTLGSKMKIKE